MAPSSPPPQLPHSSPTNPLSMNQNQTCNHNQSQRQNQNQYRRNVYPEKDETRDPFRPKDRFGFLPDVLFTQNSHKGFKLVPKARRMELMWSYLPDWLFTIAMAIVFAFVNRLHGFHREFDINDPTIQFTHATTERVPMPLLIVIAMAIPALLIVICSQAVLRSSWDTHSGLLGLALSLCLALATTATVKVTVGRPRPDMLSRCMPAARATNAPGPAYGLSNSSICTADMDSRVLQDGFRSFPSGHASTAWAGLGFLALYLAGKLHLFDRRGHTIKVWICVAPLLGATLIAISRTMDYRHHWQDVLVGSLLGAATAWFSYRLYYPPLSATDSHKPYSPRVIPTCTGQAPDTPDPTSARNSTDSAVSLDQSPVLRQARSHYEGVASTHENHRNKHHKKLVHSKEVEPENLV